MKPPPSPSVIDIDFVNGMDAASGAVIGRPHEDFYAVDGQVEKRYNWSLPGSTPHMMARMA